LADIELEWEGLLLFGFLQSFLIADIFLLTHSLFGYSKIARKTGQTMRGAAM
jgi:hypothetical protein